MVSISILRDWKQLILRVEPNATFQEPASLKSLHALETGLDVALPPDLRELLQVSDGVAGSNGLGVIWRCARILEDNTRFRESKQFRELYMPFDSLLFFADAGNATHESPVLPGSPPAQCHTFSPGALRRIELTPY